MHTQRCRRPVLLVLSLCCSGCCICWLVTLPDAQARLHVILSFLQLVAIVIPDPDYLLPWARERGLPKDMGQLCSNPQVSWVGGRHA